MEITKHGKTKEEKQYKSFICDKCGCAFKCEKDEYWEKPQTEYGLNSATYSVTKTFMTCCPECHKVIEDNTCDTHLYSGSTITSKYVNVTPT